MRGTLKLNKPKNAVAISGNLTLTSGGLFWQADGQVAASAIVVVQGDETVILMLRRSACFN